MKRRFTAAVAACDCRRRSNGSWTFAASTVACIRGATGSIRRANVPGLPEKSANSPALSPVDAYRARRSPFGLYDTVANAGDWVVNDVSSYERVYMEATYCFYPEDATAFRMLPVTDSDYLFREITARCVDAGNNTVRRLAIDCPFNGSALINSATGRSFTPDPVRPVEARGVSDASKAPPQIAAAESPSLVISARTRRASVRNTDLSRSPCPASGRPCC
jgi:hypothetical protein